MIKSKYIFDILDKIVEGLPEETPLLKKQLPYLTENDFDYTGVGVFVKFLVDDLIREYKVKQDEMVIDGIVIQSSELEIGGYALLFIRGGLIETLEILGHGDSYPERDLKDYKLIQTWIDTDFAPNIIDRR